MSSIVESVLFVAAGRRGWAGAYRTLCFPVAILGTGQHMTEFVSTMMCEQTGPKERVRDVVAAEKAGFDFALNCDHDLPWFDAMGHPPLAWTVLGAAAQATDRIPLMNDLTCPIKRCHPVVVAQKGAELNGRGMRVAGAGPGQTRL